MILVPFVAFVLYLFINSLRIVWSLMEQKNLHYYEILSGVGLALVILIIYTFTYINEAKNTPNFLNMVQLIFNVGAYGVFLPSFICQLLHSATYLPTSIQKLIYNKQYFDFISHTIHVDIVVSCIGVCILGFFLNLLYN